MNIIFVLYELGHIPDFAVFSEGIPFCFTLKTLKILITLTRRKTFPTRPTTKVSFIPSSMNPK